MWLVNLLLIFLLMANGSCMPQNEIMTPSLTQLTNLTEGIVFEILLNGRIIGGKTAALNQFPYQVAIFKTEENLITLCGGSLIKQNFILTSAHCVYEAKALLIIAGTNNLLANYGKQVRFIFDPENDIIIHPQWNSKSIKNDIALIKLEKPLIDIEVIALPHEDENLHGDQIITASGWGNTNKRGSGMPFKLQYIHVTLVKEDVCKQQWGYYMDNSKICAYSGTCSGDSGGPLILSHPLSVIGLASFSSTQCNSEVPDVFTKVAYFLPWIKEHIENEDDY